MTQQMVWRRNLDSLEKWTDRNLVKVKEGRRRGLHLGRNSPVHQYALGASS